MTDEKRCWICQGEAKWSTGLFEKKWYCEKCLEKMKKKKNK